MKQGTPCRRTVQPKIDAATTSAPCSSQTQVFRRPFNVAGAYAATAAAAADVCNGGLRDLVASTLSAY